MKKNYLLALSAMATMLFTASCQQEELVKQPQAGELAQVSIKVTTPELGAATRAFGDGESAKVLHYAVYNVKIEDGKEELTYLPELTVEDHKMDALKATVDLQLVTGNTYKVIFWADNANSPYTPNWTDANNPTVTVDYNYNNGVTCNNENYDAFFNWMTIEVDASKTEEIKLYRPFAQLNIGTSDIVEASKAGYTLQKTQVTVQAYKTLNLWGKTVSDPTDVTFNAAYYPNYDANAKYGLKNANAEGYEKFPVDGYEYMAMNYLLCPADKELVDVKFDFFAVNGEAKERKYASVPVQRNWRTNIYGQLITSDVDVKVEIVPAFDGEHYVHKIFSAEDLQAAIDAAPEGETVLYLGDDIKGDITILQKEGVNLVINGVHEGPNYKYDGTITVNGDARANGTETLTFQNICFESNNNVTFIDAPTKINGRYNYSHNVTVDNCTFSSSSYNESIVGIKLLTTYNAVIKNCSATNIHSLAQFQSTDNATVIENVTIKNCKNGISLGNMASATITGADINATGYGVRLDGEKSRAVAVTIKDATINAYIPVNVRKMNDDACNATINFKGTNDLVGDSYEIAFCSNEYEEGVDPVAPKGTFNLDGAAEFDVYFGPVTSASAFDAAINSNSGDVVEVTGEIDNVGTGFEVNRSVTLDFNGNELNAGSTTTSTWYAIQVNGDYDVEINDAYFTRAGVYAANGADVVFNSGIINHNPERTSRYIFCARNASTITIKDGTFKNDRERNAYFWADNSIIYVQGGDFGGVASKDKVVLTNGGQLIITGGTFNFDPSAWVKDGYVATQSGSTWTVTAE